MTRMTEIMIGRIEIITVVTGVTEIMTEMIEKRMNWQKKRLDLSK